MNMIYIRLLRYFQLSENAALLALAVGVGLATGIGVLLFRLAIEVTHIIFTETLGSEILGPVLGAVSIIVTLALAGLIVGWLMDRFIGEERHHGVAGVIEGVALAGGRLRYARIPFKAAASALSLGAGASVGPEDPSVQIGSNIGSLFGQRLRLSEQRVQLLVGAGAASAIAAAFHAPIAGVFFALEVILGEFTTGTFGVVVLAAVIASVFTQAVDQITTFHEPQLNLLNYTLGSLLEFPLYVLLGLLLAPLAALFIRSVYWQHDQWHRYIHLPRPLQTALAGAVVGAVGVVLPEVLGPGRDIMNAVLTDPARFTIVLLLVIGFIKILITGFSMAGGFVGGVFAPSLFAGLMFGGAFGRIVATFHADNIISDPQAYAIVGMAAMMAGVVHAPITAIMLVFELSNDYRLILPIMLAAVVCVYVAERIVPHGIYGLGLARKGVHLQQGRDIDVMQGVKVGEAMVTPPPTIGESVSLTELRDALRHHNTRSLCVVNDQGTLTGIVTLADLQSAFENRTPEILTLTVGDICSRTVITVNPDDVLWTAIRAMGARDVGRLPVIRHSSRELVGVLSRSNIVDAYSTAIARKLQDQRHAEQIRLHALTGAHVFEFKIAPGAPSAGKRISDVNWPHESVIASIQRKNKLLIPHGSTELQPDDVLTVVAAAELEGDLQRLFDTQSV